MRLLTDSKRFPASGGSERCRFQRAASWRGTFSVRAARAEVVRVVKPGSIVLVWRKAVAASKREPVEARVSPRVIQRSGEFGDCDRAVARRRSDSG